MSNLWSVYDPIDEEFLKFVEAEDLDSDGSWHPAPVSMPDYHLAALRLYVTQTYETGIAKHPKNEPVFVQVVDGKPDFRYMYTLKEFRELTRETLRDDMYEWAKARNEEMEATLKANLTGKRK